MEIEKIASPQFHKSDEQLKELTKRDVSEILDLTLDITETPDWFQIEMLFTEDSVKRKLFEDLALKEKYDQIVNNAKDKWKPAIVFVQ